MKRCLELWCICIALLISADVSSQIAIDGGFDDWALSDLLYTDALGDDGNSGIDLGELYVSSTSDYLFVSIEVGKEINFQDNNSLVLYIDTDDDKETGRLIQGIGADLEFRFGDRTGTFRAPGISTQIRHADIGYFFGPTVTSDRFEFIIDRNKSFAGNQLLPPGTIKIIIQDSNFNGDRLPDQSGGVEFTLEEKLEYYADYRLTRPSYAKYRVMSYNAFFDNIFEPSVQDEFERILKATKPDIIGFQEIYDRTSSQVAALIEQWLPDEGPWYHAQQGPDIHCISRFPIEDSYRIAGVSSSQGNGAFLVDLPDVDEPLLLVNAHTPCCEDDAGREKEFDAIMSFIRDAQRGDGDLQLTNKSPIVILGDMNMVGRSRQLRTLLEGDIVSESTYGPDFDPDWDGTSLDDAMPRTTGLPATYTWYKSASSFAPGRLDFMVYTGSVLDLDNSYALETSTLPQDTLDAYGLRKNDVSFASDHLPLIADFSPRDPSSVVSNTTSGIFVYPNPAADQITLSLKDTGMTGASVHIVTMTGKEVLTFNEATLTDGRGSLDIDVSSLPKGMYMAVIKSGRISAKSTFVKL